MINDTVRTIQGRIASACARSKRDPASVGLIAVTKGRSIKDIQDVIAAGCLNIGENRVQEAALKHAALSTIGHGPLAITWHMIGHLQTNKAKEAVRIFDCIHSVDSFRLAQVIDKHACSLEKIQDILLEVKTSSDESKFGLAPDEVEPLLKQIAALSHVRVRGLMTIAALGTPGESARSYFRRLKELRDQLNAILPTQYAIRELSMGMSDDFEVAIEEGATMVRIGRALFEV